LENLNCQKMKPGALILFLLLSQTMMSQAMTSLARTARYQPGEEHLPDFRNFRNFLSQILHSNDLTFGARDSAENVSTF
jgi:hypothetical protein